jgi:hypothetical protein
MSSSVKPPWLLSLNTSPEIPGVLTVHIEVVGAIPGSVCVSKRFPCASYAVIVSGPPEAYDPLTVP